ncbi:MAG TPA: DnaT-like ssDNA-binding protein [Phycisphaerae bacterium]|nr:DnaT-like ssDNA-binding protein [Phycisphaerae bacterium]
MALEGSYIDLTEADAYAASELDSSTWDALSDADKAACLLRATDEIDSCRWQGRKYDSDQDRQFPRLYGEPPADRYPPQPDGAGVWDWDSEANEAVVPEAVKRAAYLQAASIAEGDREARLADRHDGLAAQGAGGMSESYGGPGNVLCLRAWTLLRKYRLRSGPIV